MKIYWNGESKNIIGPRVRELRKKEKLSQRLLAARLQTMGHEFTDLTILRIEKGLRFVPDYEVIAFAEYFGVSVEYLFGMTDEETGSDSGKAKG